MHFPFGRRLLAGNMAVGWRSSLVGFGGGLALAFARSRTALVLNTNEFLAFAVAATSSLMRSGYLSDFSSVV